MDKNLAYQYVETSALESASSFGLQLHTTVGFLFNPLTVVAADFVTNQSPCSTFLCPHGGFYCSNTDFCHWE